MNRSERFVAGFERRQRAVGEEYVERAYAAADGFTMEFQDFVTESCWGSVWLRDGLDDRTRSLITLTVLACSNKWTELTTHVKVALGNGCTADEIKEVFLHLAVYAGVPTAMEAFRHAQPVVAEYGG